jgi:hypothetical protein
MLKFFSVLFSVIAFGGMAQASNYHCNASFSYLDSQLWNAGYQFSLRPGFNGTATAHVRLNRNSGSTVFSKWLDNPLRNAARHLAALRPR